MCIVVLEKRSAAVRVKEGAEMPVGGRAGAAFPPGRSGRQEAKEQFSYLFFVCFLSSLTIRAAFLSELGRGPEGSFPGRYLPHVPKLHHLMQISGREENPSLQSFNGIHHHDRAPDRLVLDPAEQEAPAGVNDTECAVIQPHRQPPALLHLKGPQGDRPHVRARPRTPQPEAPPRGRLLNSNRRVAAPRDDTRQPCPPIHKGRDRVRLDVALVALQAANKRAALERPVAAHRHDQERPVR
jgi:hypothetical protein